MTAKKLIELSHGASGGDEKSFDDQIVAFYEQYHKALFYFIYGYVHNETEATDLLQEVFCSAIDHMRRTGRVPAELRGWLFRIARNRCLNFKAHSSVINKNFQSLKQKYAHSTEFEGRLLNDLLAQDILAYIQDNFADREYEIFKLRLLHELTLQEIKVITGLSHATISRISETVITKIKAKFGEKGDHLKRISQ